MKSEVQNVDFDELVADAWFIRNSLAALQKNSIELDTRLTITDLDELNGIIYAILCLSDKHANDMEKVGGIESIGGEAD
ncbi:hypothetical protein [Enterococcus sp. AZ109]|uniref:hypothetical protein n=1 Tax=Enterococcus sp. AZ109 TaxID=2774634 RepID=UPI003F275F47